MKRMTHSIIIVSSVLILGFGNVAQAATAAEVLGWCRPDSPDHDAKLCEAYVGAIAENAARAGRIEDNLGVACVPENVTADQLGALVVEKLQPSPELENTTGFDAIAPILIKAFPCSP